MSNTKGEPARAGEIIEVQEAGAADNSVVRTPEVEEALHAISDKLFLITEHGKTIGSGAEARIVTAEYLGRRLALKIYKPDRGLKIPPEQRWNDKVFNIIAPHVCSAVGYSRVHNGKGNFAWIMPRHLLNLRELIDSQRPFPYATAVDLIVQLALGMRALHKRDIMHRDIRAANVLVTAIASPKFHSIAIADFDGGQGVIGTGFWRAPEILLKVSDTAVDKIPYDFPCDVYSFAITCYEILTGELPFRGALASDYDIILSGKRPPLPDHLPHDITSLILQCWNQDPSLRPNAAEILDLLRNILVQNPELKLILWRLDLADIWSGEETDTPPSPVLLKSLQDDLELLKHQNKTEVARLGGEFIAIYRKYESQFGIVSVWNRRQFWKKVPVVLEMVNKGNEFVNSLPDCGPNTTVQTLKTYSRLVRPIVFFEFGSVQTFIRRYSFDVLVAFVNKNGGTLRNLAEEFRVASEKFWASEDMCRVRYHWGRIVRTLKRWFGVRDTSQAQVQEQIQELLDRGLITDDDKAS